MNAEKCGKKDIKLITNKMTLVNLEKRKEQHFLKIGRLESYILETEQVCNLLSQSWPLPMTCAWVSRSLWQRCGFPVACCSVGAMSAAVPAWGLWKEVAIVFITSIIDWHQVNKREGTQPHTSTENWIKHLQSMGPTIRTRSSFPLSQSLLSGSFHKPLILLHQRADRLKTTITGN